MKNYTYGNVIKSRGYIEVPVAEYTKYQLDMMEFIKSMSAVIVDAKCGWEKVRYAIMKHSEAGSTLEYMVLCNDSKDIRWIPIEGNSKGCNFAVLGENLW